MLHYNTVEGKTLELLKSLMDFELFSNLRLVGGTSLALQLGHRISVDIDLFGEFKMDSAELQSYLPEFGECKVIKTSKNINIFLINGIKVDFVNYSYPWIGNLISEQNIRMADKMDIAAMKLAAISGRGTKKDYYDLYELLKHYTLAEMIGFYEQKYADGSVFLVLKSLLYFDDADADVMPVLFNKVPWEKVKKRIVDAFDGMG